MRKETHSTCMDCGIVIKMPPRGIRKRCNDCAKEANAITNRKWRGPSKERMIRESEEREAKTAHQKVFLGVEYPDEML